MKIVILGGTTMDILVWDLVRLPQVDVAGDEFTSRSLAGVSRPPLFTIGGNAGNVAYVLCRLGCEVQLYTSLGDDLSGRLVREWLDGVGCTYAVLSFSQATSVNFVATDARQRRYSFFHPVDIDSSAAMAELAALPLEKGDHMLLMGYPHPEPFVLQAWAARAQAAGASVALDIGPAVAGFRLEVLALLLPLLDVLYCNQAELAGPNPEEREERIIEAVLPYLRRGLVLKRGLFGTSFITQDDRIDAAAFRIEHATTVGAEDAFDAAFTYKFFAEGAAPRESLRFAAAVASIMLQRGRGTLGAPRLEDVNAFLHSG